MEKQIKSKTLLHAPHMHTYHDTNEQLIDLSKRCNSIPPNEARSLNSSFNSPVNMMIDTNLISAAPVGPIAHPIAKRPWESKVQTLPAYTKHPLKMLSPNDTKNDYSAFRDNLLKQMYGSNSGAIATNPNMSQTQDKMEPTDGMASPQPVAIVSDIKGQEQTKDIGYVERRRKNNEAAKRSRDRRRQRGQDTAARAKQLEMENMKLGKEIDECNQLLAYLSRL